jgi:hypothetical protein
MLCQGFTPAKRPRDAQLSSGVAIAKDEALAKSGSKRSLRDSSPAASAKSSPSTTLPRPSIDPTMPGAHTTSALLKPSCISAADTQVVSDPLSLRSHAAPLSFQLWCHVQIARCHDDISLQLDVSSKIMGEQQPCCRLRASIKIPVRSYPAW